MEEDAWLWPPLKGAVERKGGRLEERTKCCPTVAKKKRSREIVAISLGNYGVH